LGAVTIQFREFGVRITFIPQVTPRGTIHLEVAPEVSALDYTNGLTFQGVTVPGLSTRRVHTEVELDSGQSFAIAGLLDNRITQTLSKIPGLGDLPVLGKLFQSKLIARNHSELLVLVTPELVQPIPAGQKAPDIAMPRTDFLNPGVAVPRTPGIAQTGPATVKAPPEGIPVEELMRSQKAPQPAPQAPASIQFVPVPLTPAQSGAPAEMTTQTEKAPVADKAPSKLEL
jgi:pilus assembly protein CpaC